MGPKGTQRPDCQPEECARVHVHACVLGSWFPVGTRFHSPISVGTFSLVLTASKVCLRVQVRAQVRGQRSGIGAGVEVTSRKVLTEIEACERVRVCSGM